MCLGRLLRPFSFILQVFDQPQPATGCVSILSMFVHFVVSNVVLFAAQYRRITARPDRKHRPCTHAHKGKMRASRASLFIIGGKSKPADTTP
jgi:hypothetical protein